MSRLRWRLLFAAGAATALSTSLVNIDTTAATSTTEADSGAGEPTATIPLGLHVDGGLVTEDAVWAVVSEDDMLYRIDPETNSVVQELSTPGIGFRFDIGHGAA